MRLRHAAFTFVDSAGWHGAPCIELVLGGQLDATVLQVSNLLDKTVFDNNIKMPLLFLNASEGTENDPQEVLELCTVLKDKGWFLIGKTDGSVYPRWMEKIDHKIAVVDNNPWLGFTVNELQYTPRPDDKLQEPVLLGNNSKAIKVLKLERKWPGADLFEFMQKASSPWSLLTEARIQYVVTLIKDS